MTSPPVSVPQAKFPFTHKTPASRLQVVQTVLTKCKTSTALPSPDTVVAALTQSTSDLSQVEQQVLTLKTELLALLATRQTKDLAFRKACLAFLGHINILAQGDPTVITGVGLVAQQRAARSALVPVTTVPLALVATAGAKPGEVHLTWEPVKKARSYAIERGALATGPFVHVGVATGRRSVLTEQPSATPLYYHVAAVSPAGQGPFCDAVVAVAR